MVVAPASSAGSSNTQRLWKACSGQVALSPPLRVELTAVQVADGYILAGLPGHEDGWTVLDRAGKTLARFGGTVLALNDDYAVVQTGQFPHTHYGVYHLDH